ncbi:hypothetical protein DCC85_01210 [Paenibacillus sp. CAA11]|uniref:ABC transporter permease n=1 Tax=Paenibacillus sp. CAA11 TaxID=1532905 RepID=UPI000D36509F|nr:hypothetical protein [Paenibacillus sp. CAA11]AWB42983.1 hypothetical protein DCC85_01210 [Paenibacillus sp. CAA11]
MKNLQRTLTYYIWRDQTFMGISLFILIVGFMLPIWVGNKTGFQFDNWMAPLTLVTPLSLFFYFVIPLYLSFFLTEGFEYGSIKHVIASGYSRTNYIMGKYLSSIKVIVWWIVQFFGVFYIVYLLAALVSGSSIKHVNLGHDSMVSVSVILLNVLYLAAYAAIIMLIGVMVKRTATAVVATFIVVFGDFMISGYFRESSSDFLLWLSNHTFTTQIMKFSGIYVLNSEQILLSGISEYSMTLVIPLIWISLCLSLTYLLFRRQDIQF